MQLNFNGMTKPETAVARIREFEPPEGYHLAFSGGKDSVVLLHLAKLSGVKYRAVYNWTGIDPPELKRFIQTEYPEVAIMNPEITIWKLIAKKKMLPLRQARYCCEFLKERQNQKGEFILTGVRWQESFRRRQRAMYEVCHKDGITRYLHPIIDWSEQEVWEYIKAENIPYCSLYDEGFKRLGCILCPMTTAKQTAMDMKRWPKIAGAWKRAAYRIYNPDKSKHKTAEEYWQWWLSRKGKVSDNGQCLMFHD